MRLPYTNINLTGDLERRLAERESDDEAGHDATGAGILALEVTVGTLLLAGMLVLASHLA